MPSTAPRTVVVTATTVSVMASARAPAAPQIPSAPVDPDAEPEAAAASPAPAATGAVPIPPRVAAYTAAYAAAAAAVARRQPVLRFSPRLTPEEKEVVVNVYQYVTRVMPETRDSYKDAADKIAEITGLEQHEIYRFIRDRRLASPLELPMSLAVAWERMYRYCHEMQNGGSENADLDKDMVMSEYCMRVLEQILNHLNTRRRRRHGSRRETFTIPDE